MLNRIFEFSLRNRFIVLVFAALLVGIGVYSLGRLPIDAVPDVTPNQVQILTNASGLGPVEVEQFITFPVETAMSGLPGIEKIRSVSRFGLSAVTVYAIAVDRLTGKETPLPSPAERWPAADHTKSPGAIAP